MLLGIDVGTSGCKALVFDPDTMQVKGRGSSRYGIRQPQPGWLELDPGEVWEAVASSIREAVRASRESVNAHRRKRIEALAIVSAGLAVLPVDGGSRPLTNFILPADGRAAHEAREVASAFGQDAIYRVTGVVAHSLYGIPKLMWLRRHLPEVFSRTAKFLSLDTFIQSRLGVEPTFDSTMACRTMALDIRNLQWWQDPLAKASVGPEKFPALGCAGEPIGTVKGSVASDLGLSGAVAVYVGCHDQAAANLGAGGLEDGVLTASLGTMDGLCLALTEPVLRESLMKAHLFMYPHVRRERLWTLAMLPGIGVIPKWVDSMVAGAHDALWHLLEQGPSLDRAPSPTFLVPYLAGSATPSLNPGILGVMWGLSLGTTPAQIAQGALEGAAFETRRNLELLRREGFRWREIRATGGGARWSGWMKMRAAVTGEPWAVMRETEASALGAIMLAGLGSRAFPGENEAWSVCGRPEAVFYPDMEAHRRYEERYTEYERVASFLEANLREVGEVGHDKGSCRRG